MKSYFEEPVYEYKYAYKVPHNNEVKIGTLYYTDSEALMHKFISQRIDFTKRERKI